ncbi:MAG: hypothetical protein ACO1OB_07400 [Archangium sp.]
MRFVLAFLQGFAAIAGAAVGWVCAFTIMVTAPPRAISWLDGGIALPSGGELPWFVVILLTAATSGAVAFVVAWRRHLMDRYEARGAVRRG